MGMPLRSTLHREGRRQGRVKARTLWRVQP